MNISNLRLISTLCIFFVVNKEELKQRRERLGFTQAAFAEILGVAPNTISRYETGLVEMPKWIELVIEALEYKRFETLKKQIAE